MNKIKLSYSIPCSASFRDEVLLLAERKKVNAGDIARSIALVFTKEQIENFQDLGEPLINDREEVQLKSGSSKGKIIKRKPRIQVRMPDGFNPIFIRKALSLALAVEKGEFSTDLTKPKKREDENKEAEMMAENEKLRAVIAMLGFEILPEGVNTTNEALYVLGFPPAIVPDMRTIKARFRMLATIYHPDGIFGSHLRMSQINTAMDILEQRAFKWNHSDKTKKF